MKLVISMVSPITLQLQVLVINWYPPAGLVLSSGHTVNRRWDGIVQSEIWPSIHFQSGRSQGMSHESSPSSNSSGALYPENLRITTYQLYDDSQRSVKHREHGSTAAIFLLRYPPHSAGDREGAATCTLVFWRHNRRQRSSQRCSTVLSRLPSHKDITQSTNVVLYLDFN